MLTNTSRLLVFRTIRLIFFVAFVLQVVRQLAGAAKMAPAEVRCLRQLLSKRAAAALMSGQDDPSTPHSNDIQPNLSSSGNRASGDGTKISKSKGSSKGKSKSNDSSSGVGDKSSGSGRRPSSIGVVPPWQAKASEALLAAAPRSSIVRPPRNTAAPAPNPAPTAGTAKVVEAGEGQSLNDSLAATGFFASVGDSGESALI